MRSPVIRFPWKSLHLQHRRALSKTHVSNQPHPITTSFLPFVSCEKEGFGTWVEGWNSWLIHKGFPPKGVHPGRLTTGTYKSPMKRKEHDLNQTSRALCSMLIFRGVSWSFLIIKGFKKYSPKVQQLAPEKWDLEDHPLFGMQIKFRGELLNFAAVFFHPRDKKFTQALGQGNLKRIWFLSPVPLPCTMWNFNNALLLASQPLSVGFWLLLDVPWASQSSTSLSMSQFCEGFLSVFRVSWVAKENKRNMQLNDLRK